MNPNGFTGTQRVVMFYNKDAQIVEQDILTTWAPPLQNSLNLSVFSLRQSYNGFLFRKYVYSLFIRTCVCS